MIKVLTTVDHVIMNIVNPINFPIIEIDVDPVGEYISRINEIITSESKSNTPIVARSTQPGGSMKTLIPIKSINNNGSIKR